MYPFTKISVLSLEQATVLPYLTYRLAMDGIKIIRLENPKYGDPNRLIGEPLPNENKMNQYFLPINAGKKSITLNLRDLKGQDILKKLISTLNIDIFATNQLPSSYDKLGISPKVLQEINPRLIWLGITGFGLKHIEAAYDPILQARSGLMDINGTSDESPQTIGIPLPDLGSSEHAYGSLMKALYLREITGKGSVLNLNMFSSTLSWLSTPISLNATFGTKITKQGNSHQFFAPVNIYSTKDSFAYIAIGNDKQWKNLTKIPEFKELDKKNYQNNSKRISEFKTLNKILSKIISTFKIKDLIHKFKESRIPIAEIKRIPEVLSDPLVKSMLLKSEDPKSKLKLTLAPPPYTTPFLKNNNFEMSFPPRFGEHNNEIYKLLKFGPSEINKLKKKGII